MRVHAFFKHGEVVLDGHVGGQRVAGAQRPEAVGEACLDLLARVCPHFVNRRAADDVHVQPAQRRDPAAVALLELGDGQDYVLE